MLELYPFGLLRGSGACDCSVVIGKLSSRPRGFLNGDLLAATCSVGDDPNAFSSIQTQERYLGK